MQIAARPEGEPINSLDLAEFWPLQELPRGELDFIAQHASIQHVDAGERLIETGMTDDWAFFLRQGKVQLTGPDERELIVESGSDKARYQLSSLRPHIYTITTLSQVEWLRVDKAQLDNLVTKSQATAHRGIQLPNSDELADYPLFRDIYTKIAEDKLAIPSLPSVVVQIYRIIEQDGADARKVAKIIQTDPAITAKLIKTANSAFYQRGKPVASCSDAVVRLGLNAIKSLVTGFVMRELFQAKIPMVRAHVTELWQHSTVVAAISYVLARMTPGVNPEQALVAGLLHDIGVLAVLGYAEKYPELLTDEAKLAGTIKEFRGMLGASLLNAWNFPDTIVNAALEAEDWNRVRGSKADYTDLVIIAQLHSFLNNQQMWYLPRVYEVPAFDKMVSGQLTQELSLQILEEAKQQIAEAQSWLTI